MPLHIRTNTSSHWAQKNAEKSHAKLQKSFNRLSSGLRIDSAADDAAGLAISENMTSQIRTKSSPCPGRAPPSSPSQRATATRLLTC
ncbi:MAG: hypothetical protein HRU17_07930 [Polyangiaceae bacterium]|nr:hypothetical protein [Polyangiaceae bacterium]